MNKPMTLKLTLMLLLLNVTLSLFAQQTPIPAKDDFSKEMLDYDISKAIHIYNQTKGDFSTLSIEQQQRVLSEFPKVVTNPVTIGVTYTALQGVITSLEATIRTASGDIASQLNNLLNTANAVMAQWDYRLADRLDRTMRELRAQERRLVEDTESLIRMTQQTIRQVEIGATETARVGAGEADILAYNIVSNIKRNKEARFVYGLPINFRVGVTEPVIKIRGNFLGFKPYNFSISGYNQPIIPLGFSDNEVSVRIPEEVLSTIDRTTTIALTGQPFSRKKRLFWFGYKYYQLAPKSVLVTVKPQIDYSISVTINPQAKLPIRHTFDYSFYDIDNNCKADRRVDRTYVLPPSWSLNDDRQRVFLTNTSGPNCGSGLIGRGAYNSPPFSVVVEGRIKGCGYSGPFNTFCKGRGWWGYALQIPAKSYRFQHLPIFEQNQNVSNQSQRTFTFDYPLSNIPSDNEEVRYYYKIVILVKEGSSTRRIEISDVNPNVEGFRTRMEDNRLTLEIDQQMKLLENK